MKQLKKIFLLSLIIFSFNSTYAWIGLIGENGDIINTTKWNEMITKLSTKLDQSNIQGSTNIEVTNSGTGVVLSFTGTVSSNSIPYITSGNQFIYTSSTSDINITGLNFTPTTSITIPGWSGTINSTTINSPTNLDINLTSLTATGAYDIIVANSTVENTLWAGNGVGQLNIIPLPVWKDLRLGGDPFTDGNGAGNDIRYRSGMSMTRDANGMYFSGSNPWSSWVKFESLSWTRGENKTLEWIYTTPTSNMMIGIGSDATNETNTAQYAQAETEVYYQNATTIYGLYGNNGTIGSAGNQGNSINISSCTSGVFKQKFTNDGSASTGVVTIYCLPSSSEVDWDNTSTVIGTFTVGGTLSPNEPTIMPFIIPRSGGTQRFIAVKVGS